MKRKGLLLLFCCFVSLYVKPQSDIRINTINSNSESTYYINPASISTNYTAIFSLVARNQWNSFDGAPKSLYATATGYSEQLRSQIGAKIFSERVGYTYQSSVSLSYAYNAQLNRTWEVRFGIAGVYYNQSYDVSKIDLLGSDLAVLELIRTGHYFNADFGMEAISSDYKIGLSLRNVVSPFLNNKINKSIMNNVNTLYGMYRYRTYSIIDVGAGLALIQAERSLQGEAFASLYFRKSLGEQDFGQIGLYYRSWNEIGFILGIDLLPSLRMLYSYDYNIGGLARSAWGTHELMLIYKFGERRYCSTCW